MRNSATRPFPRRRSVGVLAVLALLLPSQTASAGLLDQLLQPVVEPVLDTVGAVLGVVEAGWDDGATTDPVSMDTVADAIRADDVWRRGYDGSGVDVAVIDTGVAPVVGLDSPGKVLNGPDLSFDSQADNLRYLDGFGHGNHMSAIIAGNDGSAHGFRGIAPGARLVNVKVGAHDGSVDVSQVIAAIDWVVQHRNDNGMNIRVLNLSYGTDGVQPASIDPLAHAVENAWRHGIVVVVGAGNDGTSRPVLTNPATNPYVIAVGAVDLAGTSSVIDDRVASFSSQSASGRSVDFVAPGVSLLSLRTPGSTVDNEHPGSVVDDRYFRGSGTSQAAAVASGAAALLVDARPGLSPDQVKALLTRTATPLLRDNARAAGSGRIDVLAAVRGSTWGATQRHAPSAGTGSIEAARGSSHVADNGVELRGEFDIMGNAWSGAAWAAASRAGAAWDGGRWNGSVWTGECWCEDSWTGASWTGHRWTGNTWSGNSWRNHEWSGNSWRGHRWSGNTWSGNSWRGASWTGHNWRSSSTNG